MYIECKADGLVGPARIGRVTFNRTRCTLFYRDHVFRKKIGFKSNYYDVKTREEYWISGPRRDGMDALYPTAVRAEIDDDVREEYWVSIRRKPEMIAQKHT